MKYFYCFILILISFCTYTQPIEKNCISPPLGWNSWTGFGGRVSHRIIMNNARFMASHLASAGYNYVVLDGGWHAKAENENYPVDQFGQMVHPGKFPYGIKALSDSVHMLGLKFGIHLMRGVAREAYYRNNPVKGTKYFIRDITDTNSICTWSSEIFGINTSKPGAQEYYDNYIGEIASWGVDFIKIDDITEHPGEIIAVSKAIEKTGMPIIFSLSPGNFSEKNKMDAYNLAHMVRITSDIWDNREDINKAFDAWKKWSLVSDSLKFWVDLDMIPFGHLGLNNPDPGFPSKVYRDGFERTKERFSAFNIPQKHTFITMRAMSASPLMIGGDLPTADSISIQLVSDANMLECDQNGIVGKMVFEKDSCEVWRTIHKTELNAGWLGIFNRGSTVKRVSVDHVHFDVNTSAIELYSIWEKRHLGYSKSGQSHVFEVLPDDVCFIQYYSK